MLLHFFSCAIYIIWCGFSLAVMWFGKSKGRAPPQGTKWATEWARQAYLNTCRDLLIRLQFETVFRERLCLMWAVVLAPFSALCCPSPSSHPVSLLPLHLNSPIPLHDHELWTSLHSEILALFHWNSPGGSQNLRNTSLCCCVFRLLDMTAFVMQMWPKTMFQ